MGVEWVRFGRGHFVPEIFQKKLAPMLSHFTTYVIKSSRPSPAFHVRGVAGAWALHWWFIQTGKQAIRSRIERGAHLSWIIVGVPVHPRVVPLVLGQQLLRGYMNKLVVWKKAGLPGSTRLKL